MYYSTIDILTRFVDYTIRIKGYPIFEGITDKTKKVRVLFNFGSKQGCLKKSKYL